MSFISLNRARCSIYERNIMNHYLNHVKSLYKRPTLNGIDGSMDLRSASPFELFLDLIFVIALSKLSLIFEHQTITTFVEATLLFMIIYSMWFTLATYTVMFFKSETNYWTRAMIFLVMIPLIFFLSIQNLDSQNQVFIFCISLALCKLFLALVFRDSIINAPLNNIVTSNLYLMISKHQTINGILLLIAAFVPNRTLFLVILIAVALTEVLIIPIKQRKIINKSFAPLLLNKQLFMERQLLFIILIFGESLITTVSKISGIYNLQTFLYILVSFSIMFMFYMRISEESEYNSALINRSNNLNQWLANDYVIFLLFLQMSEIPTLFAEHNKLPLANLLVIVTIMGYISIEHLILAKRNLKSVTDPVEAIYHQVDIKCLYAMFTLTMILLFFHSNILIIYLNLLIFFLLHIAALPFRHHLIADKCELSTYIQTKNK